MGLDADLLEQALAASAAVGHAEQQLGDANERYRRAVRRLHISGSPMREIARALNVSHQRVHQLIESAGGADRRWKLRKAPPKDLRCSFCTRSQDDVAKLVAGPAVYICDGCIGGRHLFDAVNPASTLRCSFCRKRRAQVKAMFAGPQTQMCDECLEVARDIIADPGA